MTLKQLSTVQERIAQMPHVDHSFNALPVEGFELISPVEFSQSTFFTHEFQFYEYRQILIAANKVFPEFMLNIQRVARVWNPTDVIMLPVRFFWMDRFGGFAMVNDRDRGVVYHYKFGCHHEKLKPVAGASGFEPRYECVKCGKRLHGIDTSD